MNETIEKKPFLVNLVWVFGIISGAIMLTWMVAVDRLSVGNQISEVRNKQGQIEAQVEICVTDSSKAIRESDLIKRDIQEINNSNREIKRSISRLEEHLLGAKRYETP